MLIDFETSLGFTSYRAVMAAAEDQWLQNGANPADDPDNNDPFADEVLETLLSPAGAVAINDTIHYTDPTGQEWLIPSIDCNVLQQIIADPGNGPTKYKVTYAGTSGELCKDHQAEVDHLYYDNGEKMIKWKLRFVWSWMYGGGGHTKTIAKMVMYRKKHHHWKKNRCKIWLSVHGNADNTGCRSGNYYYNSKGYKRRRKLRVKDTFQDHEAFESGNAQSTYVYPGGRLERHLDF